MKFSNRLLLFLAGVVFVLLGLFLFTNPVANLVAYSWWIAFSLLVSSIAAILGYFSAPKELRSPVYLFQGFVSLLLALYLVAYGFLTLPVVIPTIVGIWLIVDDVDQNFQNTQRNKLKVATYFTAIRQIVSALPELRIRTSVRPNVWKIIKREYEALSHIEQYMVDIHWSQIDKASLLAKRIQGYLDRTDQWELFKKSLSSDINIRNKQLISLVFEEEMKWGQNHRTRPASIVLATLSRPRPSWLIELCKEAIKSISFNEDKITFDIINAELEDFGKRRIEDTIAEFTSQCQNIEEVIEAFSQQNERYNTDELLKLIDNRILNHINLKISGIVGKPNNREVAYFLYQIAFITARRDNPDGSYEHISFEDNPALLKSRTSVDNGVSWEIHPVFRQALQLKNVDTRQAQAARRRRNSRKP